jgi:hypothetical protein
MIVSLLRSHFVNSRTVKRRRPGKALPVFPLHASLSSSFEREPSLLWPDLNQAFLGHVEFLALMPPCMEPSFPNLFSAPKLSSEAASGSAFKTKLWLQWAEKHRSQTHTCPQGHSATAWPWFFPAHMASSQSPLLSTHNFHSPGPMTGSCGHWVCS